MSPIKLKAYLKAHNETVLVDNIDFIEKEITVIDEYGRDYYFPFDEINLLQYTGLKDKNGKEIYEGYLLHPKYSKSKGTYKVVWHNNGFMIEFTFMRKFEGEEFEDKNYLPIHADDYEVIGNIYEDSHLLEQANAN